MYVLHLVHCLEELASLLTTLAHSLYASYYPFKRWGIHGETSARPFTPAYPTFEENTRLEAMRVGRNFGARDQEEVYGFLSNEYIPGGQEQVPGFTRDVGNSRKQFGVIAFHENNDEPVREGDRAQPDGVEEPHAEGKMVCKFSLKAWMLELSCSSGIANSARVFFSIGANTACGAKAKGIEKEGE